MMKQVISQTFHMINTYPIFHILGIDWLQATLWFRLGESETFSAPHKGLVPATSVSQSEGPLAGTLAEVWAQIQCRYHGWVCHNGGSLAISCHRHCS